MPIEPEEFARLLGAEVAGEVPDVGGGPFGMARLARILHRRLTPGQGERPGRPTNPSWEVRPKVPLSEATFRKLTRLARELSTAERQVSPMQVAAQLLEEALGRVSARTEGPAERVEGDPNDMATSAGTKDDGLEGAKIGAGLKTKLRDAEPGGVSATRGENVAGETKEVRPRKGRRDPGQAKARRRGKG